MLVSVNYPYLPYLPVQMNQKNCVERHTPQRQWTAPAHLPGRRQYPAWTEFKPKGLDLTPQLLGMGAGISSPPRLVPTVKIVCGILGRNLVVVDLNTSSNNQLKQHTNERIAQTMTNLSSAPLTTPMSQGELMST